jgi:large subunit ribosomal protein L28
MPYECHFTGMKTKFGKTRAWRGQAVKKGGFGLKPTGISPRTFRPNLQDVTAMVEGAPTRVKASTRAIRSGLVIKPLKRKYGYTRQQKQQGQQQH